MVNAGIVCVCFSFFRAFFFLWKKQNLPQLGTLTIGFFTIFVWTVLHELLWFCIASSTNTKKMQTYEAKFSLLPIDGAWRKDFTSWSMEGFSSVWARTGCVFSCFWVLVFVTSFLRSSSNNNSRLWGLSFWEEEDEDQVGGRSHMRQRTPAPPKGKKKKKASRRIADGSVRWRGYPHRFFKKGRRICERLGDAFVLGRELARRSLRLSVLCVCVGWRSFHQKKSQREAAPMAFWRRGGVGWWSRSLLLRNCITAFLPCRIQASR